MANNCDFSVTMICKQEDLPKARRVLDMINHTDPEYVFARTWPGLSNIIDEGRYDADNYFVKIHGEIPWTAAYIWCPKNTLYYAKEGDVLDIPDVGTRTVTSIPDLCKLWGMRAEGWEYEPGCCLDGIYNCDANGKVSYADCWEDDDEEDEWDDE